MDNHVAIIGMAGRFPGASNTDDFWRNLRACRESITFFSDEQLTKAGVRAETIASPDYVKARGILSGSDMFDASFFGFSRADAEMMDPQHRTLLELTYEALEAAGYGPGQFEGRIGVFVSSGLNTYFLNNLLGNSEIRDAVGHRTLLLNDKDYLAARISYHLNLTGPSIVVQTACSSSLVAVHVAIQSLLSGDCDIAVAGGVSIAAKQIAGYTWQEGGINSRDGHCRPFDAAASGTVFSSGLGLVVIKPLKDSIQDRDTVRAVILGSAVNNDGAQKSGFTAPSVQGQIAVIQDALDIAGVQPETISYVQAHGTGTLLGDPIEAEAIAHCYSRPKNRAPLVIGSIKGNIGHLDVAAGVAGLIATVLALEHRQIPGTKHFTRPNPDIDFPKGHLRVNSTTVEWVDSGGLRTAGVSSLGIGGTNVHLIIQERPMFSKPHSEERFRLIALSAKTPNALRQTISSVASYIAEHPSTDLTDISYSLQMGRFPFQYRTAFICRNVQDALTKLRSSSTSTPMRSGSRPTALLFVFSGQGSQYLGMGKTLRDTYAAFRKELDSCLECFNAHLDEKLEALLYSSEPETNQHPDIVLRDTKFAQSALFAIEFSLAKFLISLGIQPSILIGHSVGEYVAACLAGVMSLEDAVRLISARCKLMGSIPAGMMLAIGRPESDVQQFLGKDVSLAAVNGPIQCVLSGTEASIRYVVQQCESSGYPYKLLPTSHAFHSAMMDPVIAPFLRVLQTVSLSEPRIPIISSLTGKSMTSTEARNPRYWTTHLRETVRFGDAIAEAYRMYDPLFALEVGPGRIMGTAMPQQPGYSKATARLLPGPESHMTELEALLKATRDLWCAGIGINWSALYEGEEPRRIPLPTYHFEKQRHWIDADQHVQEGNVSDNRSSGHGISTNGQSEDHHATSQTVRDLLDRQQSVLSEQAKLFRLLRSHR